MYIRAGMNAFLDKSAGLLDTLAAEPLRVWRVTGTPEAIEAFRVAVGGVTLPDTDIVAVKTAAVVAKEVAVKTEQVAVLKASLDVATAELNNLQKVAVVEPVVEPVPVVQDVVQVARATTITKG